MFIKSVVYPLGPAGLILMPMIVGAVVEGYGYSEQQAASLASAEGMGIVVASVAATWWIRRVSWTLALIVGLLATAALNVMSAQLAEFTPLLITRFLAGFAGGSIFSVTVAALGDNRSPDRAFGVAQGVQGAMMFAAFLAAPALVVQFGAGGIFYAIAAAALAMLVCLPKFPSAGELRAEGQDNTAPVQSGLIWLALIASFLFFVNVFGLWTFIERIGNEAQLASETIATALGVAQIAAIGGGVVAALLSFHLGRHLPLVLVLVGQGLALWLLLGDFSTTTYYVCASLFQALFVLGVSYQMGAVAVLDTHGRFLVLMTAAQGLGAAVGPGVAGAVLAGQDDYSAVIYLALACCAISTVMFLWVVSRSRAE